ncbi:MAG TPA: cache domain-containing protein [Thermoanaerobaculia bacterium]|nr:cache domain-containing protein [Thermoanaerobaculia bacterium]
MSKQERRNYPSMLAKLKSALLLTLVILLGSFGFYYLHVQRKSDYLTSRNFRLLTSMGERIKTSVRAQGWILRHLSKTDGFMEALKAEPRDGEVVGEETPKKEATEEETQGKKDERLKHAQRKSEILRVIAPQLESVKISSETAPQGQKTWHEMHPGPSEPRLKIFYEAEDKTVLEGEVRLGTVVDRSLAPRQAFESVLLADSDGRVIRQSESPALGITHLSALLHSKAEREASKPLFGVSEHQVIDLAGKQYRLFIEPFSLPVRTFGKNGEKGSAANGYQETWYLCGLIAEREQVYRSMAVSSALLMFLLGGLLLAVLSWPFVKLRLMGEWQRVKRLDVLLIGVCSLAGAAIATLLLLDLFAFHRITVQAEEQVGKLAQEMEQRILAEIGSAYAQLVKLENDAHDTDPKKPKNPIQPNRRPDVYPFWDSFSLVDKDGKQAVKWSTNAVVPGPADVKERNYYERVRDQDLWHLRGEKDLLFLVEPITSWTTGEKQAALSKPPARKEFSAAMLVFPMTSLIHPVLPPDFEFVVIDNEGSPGRVLFHSDSERNLAEDFFAETDQDRRLRSAVFAKRSETMPVRYWGRDYLAHVEPVDGIPWTIVALRERNLLRAVNMEWIVTTVFFVLFYLSLVLLLLLGALVVRPAYRATWLWPDRNRDYAVLSKLLLLLVIAFVLAFPDGRRLFSISILLPFLALATTYLRLGQRSHRVARNGVCAAGCLVLLLLAWQLLGGRDPLRYLSLSLAVLSFVLAIRLDRKGPYRVVSPAQSRYAWAGVLLLLLTSVLPTLGFFETARRVQFGSFAKHGQLRLAMSMEERAKRIVREARREKDPGLRPGFIKNRLAVPEMPHVSRRGLDVYAAPFLDTRITLAESPNPVRAAQGSCGPEPVAGLPRLFKEYLPQASEQAVQMRELLHGASSDCAWQWHPGKKDGELELYSSTYPLGGLVLSSQLPQGLDEMDLWAILAGGPLLVLLFWLVQFISRYVFLLDPTDPAWPASGAGLARPGLQRFLISRSRQWNLDGPREDFLCIDLCALRDDPTAGDQWRRLLRSALDKDVLIEGFRECLMDDGFREDVLKFMEDLVERHQNRIFILSSAYPVSLFQSSGRNGNGKQTEEKERWRAVLSSFSFEDDELRSLHDMGDQTRDVHKVLQKECGSNPHLLKAAGKVRTGGTPEQVLEEFGEEAEVYYRSLWASCSRDEEVVLAHLAEDGFVNEKNRRVVRRLIARGLIRRDPHLRLMNETFRRFVVSSVCKSEVRAVEQEAAPSAWDRLQLPFFVGLATSLLFFLTTQQSLLDGSAGTVTGIVAGVPALIQMMDLFGGKFPGMR